MKSKNEFNVIKNAVVAFCIFAFILCLPKKAFTCTWLYTESAFASADAVFIGKVTKVVNLKLASVNLVVEESGKPLNESERNWTQSFSEMVSATMEISETFKGEHNKSIEVYTSSFSDWRGYGVSFKEGESFLVYAHKRKSLLSDYENSLPKEKWTQKTFLIAEADKFNEQLPLFATSICSKTRNLNSSYDNETEIKKLRSIAKNGLRLPKLPDGVKIPSNLPTRIIY